MAPYRCLDGHVKLKNTTKCLWRWEPDRKSYFFFSPPAHLFAVTYMTEMSLIVTLNNQFTSPHLTPLLPPPALHIHPKFIKNWRADGLIPVQSNILKLDLIFPFLSSRFKGVRSLIRKENSYRNFRRRLRVRLRYRTLPREEHSPMPGSGIFTRFPFDRRQATTSLRKYQV